jgi:hypothetical protein
MTQSNNPQEAEHTAEWYAAFAEKQLQELLDMEAKMGAGMRKMKKRGMDLMGEDMDEEAIEPTEEELSEETMGEEEDEEVMEPTEEELAAPRRPMRKGYGMPMKPMREKGMSMPRAGRPMPKGPMMKKKPMGDAPMADGVKPLTRDELMEKLFGKPKSGGNSPKASNPSQGKGKK